MHLCCNVGVLLVLLWFTFAGFNFADLSSYVVAKPILLRESVCHHHQRKQQLPHKQSHHDNAVGKATHIRLSKAGNRVRMANQSQPPPAASEKRAGCDRQEAPHPVRFADEKYQSKPIIELFKLQCGKTDFKIKKCNCN